MDVHHEIGVKEPPGEEQGNIKKLRRMKKSGIE